MQFGWINVFGAVIMLLIMAPNFIYAARFKDAENKCTSKLMNALEQVGRYGSFILMIINLGIKEFAFRSNAEFIAWLTLTALLIIAYWVFWFFFFKKRTRFVSLMLAVIPCLIFLTSGVVFRHWLLIIFTLIFAVGHIYITLVNAKSLEK